MKKIFYFLTAMAASAIIFAGCGNQGGEDAKTSEGTGEASTEVSDEASADENEGEEGTEDTEEEGSAEGGELTIYTWEGMFAPELLTAFEEETGIKITYANFDSDENMLAKLESTGGKDYDLVIADDYIIKTTIEAGLAQKLDKSKIANIGNVNEAYQKQFYDPEDEYTVPFGAGVQTIVYNPELVDFEITGYEDLWSDKLQDNLSVINNPRVINGMALKIMGESYNTEDTAVIEEAGKKLMELAPNIRVINDSNAHDNLIRGEVSTAILYTSQVTMGVLEKPELEIVYPKEGIGFGIMAGFIPSGASNAEAAHKFMDYILEPETAAKYFEYLGYFCTTKPAEEFISDEMKDLIVIPEDKFVNKEMIEPISAEAEEAHMKIWTEFKALTGQQ